MACAGSSGPLHTDPEAPRERAGRSSTRSGLPLKTVPFSKSWTSLTFRLRLWASMVSMPGNSDGRNMPASSFSGLPTATARPGCGANVTASVAEQNVLDRASFQPRPSSVWRTTASLRASGCSLTMPEKAGKRVGEAVVAVDACDLFDQVDLAFEIEAPAGQRHLVVAFCDLVQGAAQGLQY